MVCALEIVWTSHVCLCLLLYIVVTELTWASPSLIVSTGQTQTNILFPLPYSPVTPQWLKKHTKLLQSRKHSYNRISIIHQAFITTIFNMLKIMKVTNNYQPNFSAKSLQNKHDFKSTNVTLMNHYYHVLLPLFLQLTAI